MENLPDFETGSPDSGRNGYASYLRGLGHLVEQAYRRTNGACACGDSSCRKIPHFADESGASRQTHLVMRAEHVVQTSEMSVIQRALRFGADVPILRHGGISYLFISDVPVLPHAAPVISPGSGWIALPPYRSDDPDGNYTQPAWISSALALRPEELPQAVEVFGPSAVSRAKELSRIAEAVSAPAGERAVALSEIVLRACESLLGSGRTDELEAFLAVSSASGMISSQEAAHWLSGRGESSADHGEVAARMTKTVAAVIFSESEIDLDEVNELLLDAAVNLEHPEGGVEALTEGADTGMSFQGFTEMKDSAPEPEVTEAISQTVSAEDPEFSELQGEGGNGSNGGQDRVEFERPWAARAQGNLDVNGLPNQEPSSRLESDFQTSHQGEGPYGERSGTRGSSGEQGSSNKHEDSSGRENSALERGRAAAIPNWADALERHEAVIYSAALSLFSRGSAGLTATPSSATEAGPQTPIVPDYLPSVVSPLAHPNQMSTEPSLDDPVAQAERVLEDAGSAIGRTGSGENEGGPKHDGGCSGEEAPSALEEPDETGNSVPGAGAEEHGLGWPNKMVFDIPVVIDWGNALGSREQVTPVELVQILLGMDELSFADNQLTKLALLDMAITQIPDGADDPLRLFSYIWPDTGAIMGDLSRHLSVVELLAALMQRYELACSAGALAGEATFAELAARNGLEFFSDLIGDPELVFHIETRLLNVTTPAQLTVRLQMISKIISTLGVEFALELSTSKLGSLALEGSGHG